MHAVQRPPFSIEVFSRHDIEKIWHFCAINVFQYYYLYKHVLTEYLDVTFQTEFEHVRKEQELQKQRELEQLQAEQQQESPETTVEPTA